MTYQDVIRLLRRYVAFIADRECCDQLEHHSYDRDIDLTDTERAEIRALTRP